MIEDCRRIGVKIRESRKKKGYSTGDLSDKLNVSVGLINNLENGRNDVFKIKLLTNICKELDIKVEELLEINEFKLVNLQIDNSIYIKIKKMIDKKLDNELITSKTEELLNSYF